MPNMRVHFGLQDLFALGITFLRLCGILFRLCQSVLRPCEACTNVEYRSFEYHYAPSIIIMLSLSMPDFNNLPYLNLIMGIPDHYYTFIPLFLIHSFRIRRHDISSTSWILLNDCEEKQIPLIIQQYLIYVGK